MTMTVSWSWPPTFRAVGVVSNRALHMPFRMPILMHDHDLVVVLTAHNQGGRSSQQSGRSICRSKCLILIHDHDLVLVLTAHNRDGQSCLRRALKLAVGRLCHFIYEIFVFLYMYLRCLLGVVGKFCGTWLPFLCIATHFLLPLRYKGLERTIKI